MHLSTLICSEQMTRSAALEEIAFPAIRPNGLSRDTAFVAKKLGISREEFAAIMAAPRKLIRTIPNLQNHWIFSHGLNLFRFSSTSCVGSADPPAWQPVSSPESAA
jgi:hypothetical protein